MLLNFLSIVWLMIIMILINFLWSTKQTKKPFYFFYFLQQFLHWTVMARKQSRCFICFKILCLLCLAFILDSLLTFGLYVLLFNTKWAFFIGILSVLLFGMILMIHALNVAVGILSLFQTGLTQIFQISAGCKKNCYTISGIFFVIFYLVSFFKFWKLKNYTNKYNIHKKAKNSGPKSNTCMRSRM